MDLTVDSNLLMKFWTHVMEGARLESSSSMPLHMQPAQMPIAEQLSIAFEAAVMKWDGISLPTKTLFKHVQNDVSLALLRQLLRSQQRMTFTAAEILDMTID